MSSRLFQRVREELGLAYAIFAYKHFYQSSGQLGVYIGYADRARPTTPSRPSKPSTTAWPARAFPRTSWPTGSSSSRARSCSRWRARRREWAALPGFELHDDAYRPLDAMLAEIDAVTPDDIAPGGGEFFAPERQTVLRLGPKEQ